VRLAVKRSRKLVRGNRKSWKGNNWSWSSWSKLKPKCMLLALVLILLHSVVRSLNELLEALNLRYLRKTWL
jgi:hypothetical protein